ncbi:MAG: hypothetical protein F7C36_04765 [Desulfurococcales archaeon]|nr:hypothetical protein [Desulfurococcales archaeon]
MARTPYITKILEVKDKDTIIVMGIGKPKTIQLPEEVVEWVSESKVAIRILDELIGHYKFRTRLAHPGAIRSLILLLYSRAHGVAPYKTARKYGVAPEQLYRIERGLKKDGLYEFVINLLSLEEYGKP